MTRPGSSTRRHRRTGNPRGRPPNPPTAQQAAERRVECRYCGAQVGERCVKQNGRTYPDAHRWRVRKATGEGYLPLGPGALR